MICSLLNNIVDIIDPNLSSDELDVFPYGIINNMLNLWKQTDIIILNINNIDVNDKNSSEINRSWYYLRDGLIRFELSYSELGMRLYPKMNDVFNELHKKYPRGLGYYYFNTDSLVFLTEEIIPYIEHYRLLNFKTDKVIIFHNVNFPKWNPYTRDWNQN
jgi:hypothetical protein